MKENEVVEPQMVFGIEVDESQVKGWNSQVKGQEMGQV